MTPRNAAGMTPDELSVQDAYQEGALAGNRLSAPGLNPYQDHTPEHAAWERGRRAAVGSQLNSKVRKAA